MPPVVAPVDRRPFASLSFLSSFGVFRRVILFRGFSRRGDLSEKGGKIDLGSAEHRENENDNKWMAKKENSTVKPLFNESQFHEKSRLR